jgi:uncharacterized lipoprotein YddW (UPF0748 family)
VSLGPVAADPAPPGAPRVGSSCATDPAAPKSQLRAMWIATVNNIDWPSRTGLSEAAAKAEYVGWLDLAVRLRFNAVIVQIRPGADAFWPSRYEPWSRYLTGVAGRDPGWDPLAFMVTEAHRRNLQFHAWFNPYRISSPGGPHPEWIVGYPNANRLYYNPGIPAARQFIEDAIMDAVSRYDVDGVHFDDFFYPYPVGKQDFPDTATFAQYGAGFPNRADWRRHNIDLLIQEMHQRIQAAKPWVAFGVSPFGIWRNASADPAGSATTGLQSYDANFADTRRWVQQGWLDYIAPQLYWHIGFRTADYAALLRWWSATVAGTGVQLYIGQAAYRVGVKGEPTQWFDPAELTRHLTLNRGYPQVTGDIYFSARSLRSDRLGAISRLVATDYTRPALVPVMTGAAASSVRYPQISKVERDGARATVTWRGTGTSFAVYRFAAGAAPGPCGFADASHLVATVRGQTWTDPGGQPGDMYFVTALDRYGHESNPSPPMRMS